MPTLKIGSKAQIKGSTRISTISTIDNHVYTLDGIHGNFLSSQLTAVREPKVTKKKPKINSHSPLRKILSAIYNIIHFEYLAKPENKVCRAQLSGCSHLATQVHHKYKRDGYYLIMSGMFLPICSSCHGYVNTDSDEAIRLELSVSRKSNVPYLFSERELELMEEFGVNVPG